MSKDEPRSRLASMQVGEHELLVIATDHPCVAALAGLTASEAEVVRLVIEGMSNKAIADARDVSVKTVANQLGAIYAKLGVQSRYELAARVLGTSGSAGGTGADDA